MHSRSFVLSFPSSCSSDPADSIVRIPWGDFFLSLFSILLFCVPSTAVTSCFSPCRTNATNTAALVLFGRTDGRTPPLIRLIAWTAEVGRGGRILAKFVVVMLMLIQSIQVLALRRFIGIFRTFKETRITATHLLFILLLFRDGGVGG